MIKNNKACGFLCLVLLFGAVVVKGQDPMAASVSVQTPEPFNCQPSDGNYSIEILIDITKYDDTGITLPKASVLQKADANIQTIALQTGQTRITYVFKPADMPAKQELGLQFEYKNSLGYDRTYKASTEVTIPGRVLVFPHYIGSSLVTRTEIDDDDIRAQNPDSSPNEKRWTDPVFCLKDIQDGTVNIKPRAGRFPAAKASFKELTGEFLIDLKDELAAGTSLSNAIIRSTNQTFDLKDYIKKAGKYTYTMERYLGSEDFDCANKASEQFTFHVIEPKLPRIAEVINGQIRACLNQPITLTPIFEAQDKLWEKDAGIFPFFYRFVRKKDDLPTESLFTDHQGSTTNPYVFSISNKETKSLKVWVSREGCNNNNPENAKPNYDKKETEIEVIVLQEPKIKELEKETCPAEKGIFFEIKDPNPELIYEWFDAEKGGNKLQETVDVTGKKQEGYTLPDRTARGQLIKGHKLMIDVAPSVSGAAPQKKIEYYVQAKWGTYADATGQEQSWSSCNLPTKRVKAVLTVHNKPPPAPAVHCAKRDYENIVFTWPAVANAASYEIKRDLEQHWKPANGKLMHTEALGAKEKLTLQVRSLPKTKGCLPSQATSIESCYPARSILLSIQVPNAFTPNADGKNDYIWPFVDPEMVSSFEFLVRNQWGTQNIFYTDKLANNANPLDTNGKWDGTYKGEMQPAGVYVYQVKATLIDGKKHTKTGSITLIR